MGVKELGKLMGKDMNEQDRIKTQFGSSDVAYYIKLFTDNMGIKDRGARIKQKSIAGDTLIWGSPVFGIWGTGKWGNTTNISFVLGNAAAAILGTSKLGSQSSAYSLIRVVHPSRIYVDTLYTTFFKDTTAATNATWGTTGTVTFTGGNLTATSLTIYKNNETVTQAKLTAIDSGNVVYQMSADTGSNWETVTSGTNHAFTNTGQEIKWRASATASANISSIEISY